MNTKNEDPKATKIYPQQLKHPNALLWRQVKAAAIMEGKTITEYVEEILREHLAKTEKSGKEKK